VTVRRGVACAEYPPQGGWTARTLTCRLDITHRKILYLKASLFLLAGVLAAAGILIQHPSVKVVILLTISIWCFARAYYFAFHVLQHWVDPQFRYRGLFSLLRYLCSRSSSSR
jgi:hypothetical protein